MKSLRFAIVSALAAAHLGCGSTKTKSSAPLAWPGESRAGSPAESDPKAGHAPKEPKPPLTYGGGSIPADDDSAEDAEAARDDDSEAVEADEHEPSDIGEADAEDEDVEEAPEEEPVEEPGEEPGEDDFPDDDTWE